MWDDSEGGADVMHRLFNCLAALMLVACVAMLGLWARSYWITDTLERADGSEIWESRHGRLMFEHFVPVSPWRLRWSVGQKTPMP